MFTPWIEVACSVRVRLAEWEHVSESWVHWAVATAPGGVVLGAARRFDPGRRAGAVGAPAVERQSWPCVLDQVGAEAVCEGLLARWQPRVHRHGALGIVSELDEDLDSFRRRALSPLGSWLRRTPTPGAREAVAVAALAGGIESRLLVAGTMELAAARVGVGWYGEGTAPEAPDGELLTFGSVRESR